MYKNKALSQHHSDPVVDIYPELEVVRAKKGAPHERRSFGKLVIPNMDGRKGKVPSTRKT